MMPAVELHKVSRIFRSAGAGDIHALRDIDLSVQPGTVTAVTGRSGSGKSTLLHLIAGIDLATAGEVRVQGQLIHRMSDAERTRLRRTHIGLVFQFFHLLPHLSVRDNVALPLLIAGQPWKSVAPRVAELLNAVGLANRAEDSTDALSGGEMQRVAICRSLVHAPSIVLADEPTGNLDDATGREVMTLMFRLIRERGHTLIFVTHSTELAASADRTCTIKSGVLTEA